MLHCCMPKTKNEISASNDDTNFEMKPTTNTELEYVSQSGPTADQGDESDSSGRLVSFQSLSNLPNIIFQEKLNCMVSLFYMSAHIVWQQRFQECKILVTGLLHETHLNEECYGILHNCLKCNLINFEIPNGFP